MLATFVVNLSKPNPPKPTIYLWYHDMFATFVANFQRPKLSKESTIKQYTWQLIYMLAIVIVNLLKPKTLKPTIYM